jgi:hypothetical protein
MADKYWAGDIDECDTCGFRPRDAAPAGIGTVMYDCVIVVGGGRRTWACVCQACFDERGLGLGTGLGQRYFKQADGRWLKTAG